MGIGSLSVLGSCERNRCRLFLDSAWPELRRGPIIIALYAFEGGSFSQPAKTCMPLHPLSHNTVATSTANNSFHVMSLVVESSIHLYQNRGDWRSAAHPHEPDALEMNVAA